MRKKNIQKVVVKVRVTCAAAKNRIIGFIPDILNNENENGPNDLLRVHLTALPIENQANEILIKLLAKEFGLKKSAIAIVNGEQSRNKLIEFSLEQPSKVL